MMHRTDEPRAAADRALLLRATLAVLLAALGLSALTTGCSSNGAQYHAERESGEVAGDASSGYALAGKRPPIMRSRARGESEDLIEIIPGPFDEVWVIARGGAGDDRPHAAGDDEAMPGTGSLVAAERDERGRPVRAFPLESTDVRAELLGPVATVRVAQRFSNPYADTIEAAYVFPLPHDAAVSDFVMTVGERRIRGIVREREEARRIYENARANGHVASLLAEERPNVFLERIANIEPGRAIDVELTYFNMLAYADGWYEWRLPLVVGPRFNPPGTSRPIESGPVGTSARRGEVGAVEHLAPGERTGHELAVEAVIDAGVPIEEIECPTHAIAPIERSGTVATVRLARPDREVNRDVVLRWRVGGREPRYGLVSGIGDDGRGTFALTVYPPTAVADGPRMPIDIVFLVDRSGSMQGEPLGRATLAVRAAIERLGPDDRFQIVDFGSDAGAFADALRPASASAVEDARRYLRDLRADGGTDVLVGIAKALATAPKEEGRVQYLVLVGDGYVGNEAEICARLSGELGDRRVFAVGVGSSVNWHLMHLLATVGRGAVTDLPLDGEPSAPMIRFMDAVTRPALQAARIDWSRGDVDEVLPSGLPDIVAGRPVTVVGRYDRAGRAQATLRGWLRGSKAEVPLAFDLSGRRGGDALSRIWARAKVSQLSFDALVGRRAHGAARREILDTALAFGIASPYTSFVAVDGSTITAGSARTTVVQPVAMPEGVRYDTTVAPAGEGSARR